MKSYILITLPLVLLAPHNIFPQDIRPTFVDTTLARDYYAHAKQLKEQAHEDSCVINYLNKAAAIYESAHDWPSYLKCLIEIGNNFLYMGDDETTRLHLERTLTIAEHRLAPNHPHVAGSHRLLGYFYGTRGNFELGTEYLNKAIRMTIESVGQRHPRLADLYDDFGLVYIHNGDYDSAIEFSKRAADIRIEVLEPNDISIAVALDHVGVAYGSKGDHEEALRYFQEGLKIRSSALGEGHWRLILSYGNVAITYSEMAAYKEALQYYGKILEMARSQLGETNRLFLDTLYNMGVVYERKQEYEKALEYYRRSFPDDMQKFPFDVAQIYRNIGDVYLLMRDYDNALASIQMAIVYLVENFDDTSIDVNPQLIGIRSDTFLLKSLASKADALVKLFAHKSHDINDLRVALDTYLLSVQLVTKMRSSYKAESSKLFLAETASKIYEQAIETSLKLFALTGKNKYKESAFTFAEEGKAGVLWESLAESQAKKFSGIPDSLLALENRLKGDLAAYDAKIQTADRETPKMKEYEKAHFDLNLEFQQLLVHFEKSYPRYHTLRYEPRCISLAKVQGALDDKTVILEYFLGDSLLTIFAISRDDFDVISFPADSVLTLTIETFVNSIKKLNTREYLRTAHNLYNRLIAPVSDRIARQERLIIIPHGVLFKIAFEALLTQKPSYTGTDFISYHYLLRDFEVSYHYSTALFLRTLKGVDGRRGIRDREFIGFAPVFSDSGKGGNILASKYPVLTFEFEDEDVRSAIIQGKRFSALRHSQIEVESIVNLFEKNKRSGVGYFHKAASEENFKNDITECRYLHIATHALINGDRPKLSGIIFSQPSDSSSREDGILYAAETYNLNLTADLVTLSSCESGIGKLVRGEGLMALTRGFLYSGARNLIVSLWKVSDKHTSQLMIELYKNILQGKSYSAALREAKLMMLKNPATAFPKSWSSFILIGQ